MPLELFYKVDNEPTYGITSDDDLRATDAPALPFQAVGALGMARLGYPWTFSVKVTPLISFF